MKKIEAIIVAPEEIHYVEYWTPSHGVRDMIEARSEGKLVLIHRCDCGCFRDKELLDKSNHLIKDTFGNDPFVVFFQLRTGRKNHVLLVPNESEGSQVFPWWR